MSDAPIGPDVLAEAGLFFDDVVLFGTKLREMELVNGGDELSKTDFQTYADLYARAIRFKGLQVTYSGEGLVPACDPDGDVYTIYGNVSYATATFKDICILDTDNVSYIKPESVETNIDDDTDTSLALLDPEQLKILEFKRLMHDAPEGLQVFVEFLLKHVVGVDEPVRGHSVRVPEYSIIHTIAASSLEVHDIGPRKLPQEQIEQKSIKGALKQISDYYRQHIRSKVFRNLPLEEQQQKVEKFILDTNDLLALERFVLRGMPQNLYLPDNSRESGFEYCVNVLPFTAECVRFDCIETKLLSEGKKIQKRRGNVNSITSTCVVVQVDDETKRRLGIDASIVWVPITNQLEDVEFVEESIFT